MAVLQAKARPNCLTLHRGPPPVHFEGKVYDSEEKVNIKYIGGLRPYIKQEDQVLAEVVPMDCVNVLGRPYQYDR